MQALLTDDFYLVYGVVSEVARQRGVTQFRMDDRWYRFLTAHARERHDHASCTADEVAAGDEAEVALPRAD